MGKLYVVATPIGNLEDVTLRAVRVLKEVGLVAAEDTRTTRKLLSSRGIRTPLLSYNQHNAPRRIPHLLRVLESTDVALVSEAGVPAISDPGFELVRRAAGQGVAVVPVPGPSAVTAALSVAGQPADSFFFLGFLPRAWQKRRAVLRSVASLPQTLVLFEAPHRLTATLGDLLALLGDREATVCRELTKLHEEVFRGRISDALAHFGQPRGEFVLVLAGIQASPDSSEIELEAVGRELARLRAGGLGRHDAVAQVMASHGVGRRQAYRLWLALAGEESDGKD